MANPRFDANTDINSMIALANSTANLVNPEVFYSKQLLDTIRYDAEQYVYYRLADESPIQEKADKLTVRRWAPLQAHTVPLTEGVPPITDKGSVEKYEIQANQYGRYMEFSDKVDFNVVDPVIAHYTKEYSLVAMETLDLLAKEVLFATASKYYAGGAANFEGLTISSKPTITDLRCIVLAMKKALVKPRSNGRFHVIGSPEFYYDLISDPTVEKYMTYNQTTSTMYSNTKLVPMFDMEFYETLLVPTSGEYTVSDNGTLKTKLRLYRCDTSGSAPVYKYASSTDANANYYKEYYTTIGTSKPAAANNGYWAGYIKDTRTNQDASYLPKQFQWGTASFSINESSTSTPAMKEYTEFKAQHILVVGKDALIRTGLSGEGNAKVYVKQKGSTGVLDPIDQRQSIGFKINSVGFANIRSEAVCDYICVPSMVNTL